MSSSASASFSLDAAHAVLDQSVIEQSVPRPKIGDWWQELIGRFFAFVAQVLNLESVAMRRLVFSVAWAVIAIAVLALFWLVWSWWRGRRGGHEESMVLLPAKTTRVEHSEGEWSKALVRAFAAGDVPAALQAMWLLLASRLSQRLGDRAQSQDDLVRLVTSREWTPRLLLNEAGPLRASLGGPVRELERHTYGGTDVGTEQLEDLWRKLEHIVPPSRIDAGPGHG